MNTKPKMWLEVCASLLVGTAALTTSSALSATEPQDDLLRANVEALTSGEFAGGTGEIRSCFWETYDSGSPGVVLRVTSCFTCWPVYAESAWRASQCWNSNSFPSL